MNDRRRAGLLQCVVFLLLAGGLCLLALPDAISAMDQLTDETMSDVSGQEGLLLDVDLDATASALQFADNDGTASGAGEGQLIFNNLTLGNGSGGSASLQGISVDADGGAGRVIVATSGDNFTAQIDAVCVDAVFVSTDDCGLAPSFGQFTFSNISLPNTHFDVGGLNEGLIVDLSVIAQLDHVRVDDTDGGSSSTSGSIQFGNGRFILDDGTAIDDSDDPPNNSPSPASLSGLTLNADGDINVGGQTGGLVVGMPSGNFTLSTDTVYLGDPSNGNSFGVDAHNINMNNTSLEISGH